MKLQLPVHSVPITTKDVSSNPAQARQHYVTKFVSGLRQVDGFLRVLWFPPPIKQPQYELNIVESGVKHHKTTNHPKLKVYNRVGYFYAFFLNTYPLHT